MWKCVICQKTLDSGVTSTIRKKGLESFVAASEKRKDGLANVFSSAEAIQVHLQCRIAYSRPHSIEKASRVQEPKCDDEELKPTLRSSIQSFNIKENCLFCGEEASSRKETKKEVKYRRVIHEVRTLPFAKNICHYATQRGDEWANIVRARVDSVVDLVAAEAKYHKQCYAAFASGNNFDTEGVKQNRRPTDRGKQAAFLQVCKFLESSEDCQFTLTDLQDYMERICEEQECDTYSKTYLKEKLMDHYGQQVSITELPGKNCVVNLKETADSILYEKWYEERKTSELDERRRIVEKAAEIVKEDIRTRAYNLKEYPQAQESALSADVLPDTLALFLDRIITTKSEDKSNVCAKKKALGQAIVAACRPKSFVPPILLGVGAYVHRHFGSRQLVDLLHNIGFSVSYNEILRYENCVIVHNTNNEHIDTEYIQFSFDNADFNVRTMTGHGTFHSMGGIMMSTPAPSLCETSVARIQNVSSATVTSSKGHMDITWYQKSTQSGLKKVIARKLEVTSEEAKRMIQSARAIDTLWLAGNWAGVVNPVSWSGYMKSALCGEMSCERSQVDALPFINLSPSNPSAIYSALLFASRECVRRGQKVCPVTFDQPLFIKAAEIVAAEDTSLASVVVRLGGFHMIMAFMGAIGFIMSGSGLETLWEQVYAKASVVHMVSGHAYARALRAHLLTQKAIGTILLQYCSSLDSNFKEKVMELHCRFLSNCDVKESEMSGDPVLQDLVKTLNSKVKELSSFSRTAKLWLQYYEQVEILRFFIRAERTGNWQMHLDVVQKMIPYFHAGGRVHYARASHLYVQEMQDLETKMNVGEFLKFTDSGYFTIRRNHDFWSGVWTDQVIEQDLMRPLKSQGGLTRGRGITESTLTHYIHSFPGCLKLCNAMEELCGMTSSTSEQHVDLRESRRSMDCRDLVVFQGWLEMHSPFLPSEHLHSLGTGVIGDDKVNCDEALEVGERGVANVVGKSFAEMKISRKSKVIPLSAMNGTVTIRDEVTPVNSSQLFMRIVCVLKNETEKAEYFNFELAPTPPSLFDGCSMRKTDKSAFTSLFKHTEVSNQHYSGSSYVIDGGYLLHAALWPRLATYGEICDIYVRHVTTRYPAASTIVVFDGYNGQPTTKEEEQRRRAARRTCLDVEFTENSTSTASQADFLANKRNKSRLIELLVSRFEAATVPVRQADGDGDVLIVETALEMEVSGKSVTVVGNDTDLLAMLIARRQSGAVFMLHPGTSNRSGKLYDIGAIQGEIGGMKNAVLFAHAVSGGDKTSAIYGKGKKKAYRLLEKNVDLREEVVKTFSNQSASRENVCSVGEKFIRALYPGGTELENIDDLRHRLYKITIARQSLTAHFELATLPPTRAALRQHSMRTYLQVQEWLGKDLDPTKWGWQTKGNTLRPVPTTLPSAPASLLLLIACDCKTDCGVRCGCRRSGQQCLDMCSHCHGHNCTNAVSCYEADQDPDMPDVTEQ